MTGGGSLCHHFPVRDFSSDIFTLFARLRLKYRNRAQVLSRDRKTFLNAAGAIHQLPHLEDKDKLWVGCLL